MRRPFKIAVVLLGLLGLLNGCKKKQPQVPPPQAQAPAITITHIPQPQPTEPMPPPGPPQPAGKVEATKPKPKPSHKINTKKAPKPEPGKIEPGKNENKRVIQNEGSEPAAQLSAGLPQEKAIQQRVNTAQLLAVTDSNLRNLKRSLSADEQAMIQQIRTYMQQSRSAESEGDTERAYNLALKARLLSDELIK